MNRFRLYSLTGALVLMLAMVSSPAMVQGGPPGGEEAGNNLSIPCVTAVQDRRHHDHRHHGHGGPERSHLGSHQHLGDGGAEPLMVEGSS